MWALSGFFRTMKEKAVVLSGMQVIDLTSGVAGPMVGMILADFGADVVKVERPGGELRRSEPGFVMWNRGKRGVVVDPSDPVQCAWLERLILGADVCLVRDSEALGEFGLDIATLTADSPSLVLSLVPPYAGPAPWSPGVEESNGLLAAVMAVASRQSSYSGDPVDPTQQHLLYIHAVWAAACTVAALVEREESGFGQVVSVSGVQAVLALHAGAITV